MTEPVPLLELEQVEVAYPNGRKALDGDLSMIDPGERVVLLGINGCGKSTLLRVLDGLIPPSRGTLRFAGRRIDRATLQDRAWQRDFRQRVVLMFQHPESMLFNPTVRDEIGFGLRHLRAAEQDRRIREWAELLRLREFLDAPPFELSGEKQRLCLACLLAVEPEVLLLDEPTANLDPRTVGWLLEWLRERPFTSIVATHQMALVPQLGERIVILSADHRIVFDSRIAGGPPGHDLLVTHGLAYGPG